MIEIDLRKLERGQRTELRSVKRGGKVFQRKTRVGHKEVETLSSITESPKIPPNYELMSVISQQSDRARAGLNKDPTGKSGFIESDSELGTVTWKNIGDYDPVDYRIEGNTIIRIDDNSQITIPESEIIRTQGFYRESWPKWFTDLDDEWGQEWDAQNPKFKENFKKFNNNQEMYMELMKELDTFIPEYEMITGEGGKYSDKMKLKKCTNSICPICSAITMLWYSGDADKTALVGRAVNQVFTGKYNKDNVVQQQIPTMIEACRKVNKSHGSDIIYRGETNKGVAQSILYKLDRTGEASLDDKLISCTENEKLGKWYAAVHKQVSAQGTMSKTHVMLKIPREKFGDNVIMDYRSTGSGYIPEEEVTIVGNGMTLTGDDIMVHAKTPKRKTKKWMTFNEFKTEGGNVVDDIIREMV